MVASDNETVADIGATLRRFAKGEELPIDNILSFTSLADRIEAAHRREIAELEFVIADNDRVSRAVSRCCSDEKFALNEEIVRRDETIAGLSRCLVAATDHICANCGKDYDGKCDNCVVKCRWRKVLGATEGAKKDE